MVTLRNTKDRRQIFELPHDFICSEDECFCTVTERSERTHDPATGEFGTRTEEVRLPFAVHIGARASSQALPDGAVDVPAVAAAISRGTLIAD
jgi:hypothetical protein